MTSVVISLRDKSDQVIDLTGKEVGKVDLRGCKKITFKNGVFRDEALILDSSGITFQGGKFLGEGANDAVTFRRSTDVSVLDAVFLHPRCGVKFINAARGLVSASSVSGMTVDGVDISSSQDIEVSDCAFSGSLVLEGQHPDCVQIWTDATSALSAMIRVLRNQAQGSLQGFSCFGKPRGAKDVEIAYNRINTSRPNGITLNNVEGGKVHHNELMTLPRSEHQTKMNLCPGTQQNNNTVAAGAGKPARNDPVTPPAAKA